MPSGSGFDVLALERVPAVVHHSLRPVRLRAFEANALDYLPPVDRRGWRGDRKARLLASPRDRHERGHRGTLGGGSGLPARWRTLLVRRQAISHRGRWQLRAGLVSWASALLARCRRWKPADPALFFRANRNTLVRRISAPWSPRSPTAIRWACAMAARSRCPAVRHVNCVSVWRCNLTASPAQERRRDKSPVPGRYNRALRLFFPDALRSPHRDFPD